MTGSGGGKRGSQGKRSARTPRLTLKTLRLALPKPVRHWSLTTLREKLIKIGAKVTRHAKYVTFQLAEVAVTRNLFAAILARIARLAIPPPLVGLIRVYERQTGQQ